MSTPGSIDVDSSRETRTGWKAEPTRNELLLLCAVTCMVFVGFVSLFRAYFVTVDDFGDSAAYMNLASAIRHWDFRNLVIKQFWGLPYAMAILSTLTRISDRTSLLVISGIASFVAVTLAWRLWGGWIAGFFAVLNFDWLQRSYLGGSEPLFVALLFGSFLAVRKERWLVGALLASLATVVRPLGAFALVGIGVALLWRRNYRTLLLAIFDRGGGGRPLRSTLGALFRRSPGDGPQLSQQRMAGWAAVWISVLRDHQGHVD